MKRILMTAAAVAASVGAFAAPASAQDVPDPNDYLECITPVTSCVQYYADGVLATVDYYYDWTMATIQNGPNINDTCKIIWPDGCSMPTP